MRGIEGALRVLGEVREGRFAPPALRKLGAEMSPEDLTLASSLVYSSLRRMELWRTLFRGFLKGESRRGKRDNALPTVVQDCLLVGTAGLLDLQHFAGGVLVNGLLDCLKARSLKRWVPLVNAVLHGVGEGGAARMEALRRSPSLEDRALWAGVPVWSLPAWTRSWPKAELVQLLELLPCRPSSALRPAPGGRDELLRRLRDGGMEAEPSDLSEAVHLTSTVLPQEVPGFAEGLCTVQSEGSILAASLAARFCEEGSVLDLCCGRGVKAGQLLQSCPSVRLEGWELSEGRHRSAEQELRRLGVAERAELRLGSALELEPREAPSVVLLDAPCSGSGTWSRKPESKWRLNWDRLDRLAAGQRALLERALALCAPRGIIIYITCSLLRQENEGVAAEVLARHPECVPLPIPWEGGPFRRGRPLGAYIWPQTPWLDGFYCCIIAKK